MAMTPVTAAVTTFSMFVSIYPPGGAGARAAEIQFARTICAHENDRTEIAPPYCKTACAAMRRAQGNNKAVAFLLLRYARLPSCICAVAGLADMPENEHPDGCCWMTASRPIAKAGRG